MRSRIRRRWLPLTVPIVLAIVGGLGGIWAATKAVTAPMHVTAPPVPLKSANATISVALDASKTSAPPPATALASDGTARGDEGMAAQIDRLAPLTRRGDAEAAYRVYQADALCVSADKMARLIDRGTMKDYPKMMAFVKAQLAETERACSGVTPAELGERFGFLDQAIRAGNRDAMRSYRLDEPTGVDVYRSDGLDPRAIEWRRNANAYLEILAGEGDRMAWSLLSTDYRFGMITGKDLGASLRYQVAYEATISAAEKSPSYVVETDRTVAVMPPEEAEAAMAQGHALAERFPATRP